MYAHFSLSAQVNNENAKSNVDGGPVITTVCALLFLAGLLLEYRSAAAAL